MTVSDSDKYASYNKMAWRIYTVLAIILIVFLVTIVAQDMEEQFFYGMMTAAVSYVFRPTEKFMRRQISRFTTLPEETNDD
jgi:hypothetical protein